MTDQLRDTDLLTINEPAAILRHSRRHPAPLSRDRVEHVAAQEESMTANQCKPFKIISDDLFGDESTGGVIKIVVRSNVGEGRSRLRVRAGDAAHVLVPSGGRGGSV
jgi:hypothetical protein